MRSEKHSAAHAVVSPGINQSHGTTATMADADWLLDGELRKKIGKCVQRFVVHIADGTRFGNKIGVPQP